MPKIHELKTLPHLFEEVLSRRKTFEIRFNDRNFVEGDVLILKEFAPVLGFTGREARRRVIYILHGGQFGLQKGYVAMAIKPERKKTEGISAGTDGGRQACGAST